MGYRSPQLGEIYPLEEEIYFNHDDVKQPNDLKVNDIVTKQPNDFNFNDIYGENVVPISTNPLKVDFKIKNIKKSEKNAELLMKEFAILLYMLQNYSKIFDTGYKCHLHGKSITRLWRWATRKMINKRMNKDSKNCYYIVWRLKQLHKKYNEVFPNVKDIIYHPTIREKLFGSETLKQNEYNEIIFDQNSEYENEEWMLTEESQKKCKNQENQIYFRDEMIKYLKQKKNSKAVYIDPAQYYSDWLSQKIYQFDLENWNRTDDDSSELVKLQPDKLSLKAKFILLKEKLYAEYLKEYDRKENENKMVQKKMKEPFQILLKINQEKKTSKGGKRTQKRKKIFSFKNKFHRSVYKRRR